MQPLSEAPLLSVTASSLQPSQPCMHSPVAKPVAKRRQNPTRTMARRAANPNKPGHISFFSLQGPDERSRLRTRGPKNPDTQPWARTKKPNHHATHASSAGQQQQQQLQPNLLPASLQCSVRRLTWHCMRLFLLFNHPRESCLWRGIVITDQRNILPCALCLCLYLLCLSSVSVCACSCVGRRLTCRTMTLSSRESTALHNALLPRNIHVTFIATFGGKFLFTTRQKLICNYIQVRDRHRASSTRRSTLASLHNRPLRLHPSKTCSSMSSCHVTQ